MNQAYFLGNRIFGTHKYVRMPRKLRQIVPFGPFCWGLRAGSVEDSLPSFRVLQQDAIMRLNPGSHGAGITWGRGHMGNVRLYV